MVQAAGSMFISAGNTHLQDFDCFVVFLIYP